MNRLYVYAFVDRRLPRTVLHGHAIASHALGRNIYALAERRAESPAPSEMALREQHAIMIELAKRSAAILPARFGSIVDRRELERIVSLRARQLRDALHLVRDREQMTVRLTAAEGNTMWPETPASAGNAAAGIGTAYLAERRAAAGYPLPGAVRELTASLREHVVADKAEPGRGRVRAIVYHLITRGGSDAYRRALNAAAPRAQPFAIEATGPWPPFAFAPELLG